jgi:cellulose synthase/poly-beta-1,6-N-acetylglucosamine synthase-like glycosyltransferase
MLVSIILQSPISQQITSVLQDLFNFYTTAGHSVYAFYSDNPRTILEFIHFVFNAAFKVLIIMTAVVSMLYLVMGISVLFRKRPKQRAMMKGKEPTVTIQIPTYNELAALNCAQRCLEFDYPKEKYGIIIGDDSNKPEISAKIDEFASRHSKMVKVTRRGNNAGFKPGNLNYMLERSYGEIIVIFDSDFLPDRDFLRRIVAPFTIQKDISVVQARWNIDNFNQNLCTILGGTISLICHNITLPFIIRMKGSSFLCGSAEAVRRKDIIEVGGWKAGSLTEDIECSFRFMKEGKKLLYLEDLECKCEAPQNFKDLCKQQKRWAYGVISAFKEHFISLLRSPKTRSADRLSTVIFASGYMFSILLLLITASGFLSIISNRPVPIDWPLFLSETAFNIAITSGLLLASIIALALAKRVRQVPKMIAGSLSIGLLVTFHVHIGIYKALFNKHMHWFMLTKNGNATKK